MGGAAAVVSSALAIAKLGVPYVTPSFCRFEGFLIVVLSKYESGCFDSSV